MPVCLSVYLSVCREEFRGLGAVVSSNQLVVQLARCPKDSSGKLSNHQNTSLTTPQHRLQTGFPSSVSRVAEHGKYEHNPY